MSETTSTTPPSIGQPWPEQGGIYVGSRIIDGQAHHLITPAAAQFRSMGGDVSGTFAAWAGRVA